MENTTYITQKDQLESVIKAGKQNGHATNLAGLVERACHLPQHFRSQFGILTQSPTTNGIKIVFGEFLLHSFRDQHDHIINSISVLTDVVVFEHNASENKILAYRPGSWVARFVAFANNVLEEYEDHEQREELLKLEREAEKFEPFNY